MLSSEREVGRLGRAGERLTMLQQPEPLMSDMGPGPWPVARGLRGGHRERKERKMIKDRWGPQGGVHQLWKLGKSRGSCSEGRGRPLLQEAWTLHHLLFPFSLSLWTPPTSKPYYPCMSLQHHLQLELAPPRVSPTNGTGLSSSSLSAFWIWRFTHPRPCLIGHSLGPCCPLPEGHQCQLPLFS